MAAAASVRYVTWPGSAPPSAGLYAQEVTFRRAALWPSADPGRDIRFAGEDAPAAVHVSAMDGERLIGSVVFLPPGQHAHADGGRLCQMAVDPAHQGRGVGRRLVRLLEGHLQGTWTRPGRVYVHAQLHAVGFYAKLGYGPVPGQDDFDDEGVLHRLLVKVLEPAGRSVYGTMSASC